MNNCNNVPVAGFIAVRRRPGQAKRIPIVANHAEAALKPHMAERWARLTPLAREIIRKNLWVAKRELRQAQAEFDAQWAAVAASLNDGLFQAALARQDQPLGESIARHLDQTHQWPAFRAGIQRAADAFEQIAGWPGYKGLRPAVDFLKQLAGEARASGAAGAAS